MLPCTEVRIHQLLGNQALHARRGHVDQDTTCDPFHVGEYGHGGLRIVGVDAESADTSGNHVQQGLLGQERGVPGIEAHRLGVGQRVETPSS